MVENAAARAIRLLDLVPYLKAHPGIGVAEVANEFGISKTDLMKDLNLLFVCGLPGYTALELIDLSFEDGVVVIKDAQNLDSPRAFTEEEALILRIALAGLEDAVPNSHKVVISALREKVAKIFNSEIPNSALVYRGTKEQETLRILQRAIDGNLKVEITYLNPTRDSRTRRRISPERIELGRNRTLVSGWCDSVSAYRTFNLLNIVDIELTNEVRNTSGGPTEILDYRAVLEANADSWFIHENDGYLKELDGNRYEIDIFQEEWLLRCALASAGELRIVEPSKASNRLRSLAERALSNYA